MVEMEKESKKEDNYIRDYTFNKRWNKPVGKFTVHIENNECNNCESNIPLFEANVLVSKNKVTILCDKCFKSISNKLKVINEL